MCVSAPFLCAQAGGESSLDDSLAATATRPPRLVQFFSMDRALYGSRVVKVSCGWKHQVALTGRAAVDDCAVVPVNVCVCVCGRATRVRGVERLILLLRLLSSGIGC